MLHARCRVRGTVSAMGAALYRATSQVDVGTIDVWRGTPGGEFVDGALVTRRELATGPCLRLAVFDPAENVALPNARALAHHAVGVATSHFAGDVDAAVAIAGANAELHDPGRANMANSLVTAVWADVAVVDGPVVVLDAGRVGDGEVAVIDAVGNLRRLCQVPMWTDDAATAWRNWVSEHRPDPVALWRARQQWVGERSQYHSPHLGQFGDPSPEVLAPGTGLVVATDGAELDVVADCGDFDLAAHLAAITGRPARPDVRIDTLYSHSDLAVIRLQTVAG